MFHECIMRETFLYMVHIIESGYVNFRFVYLYLKRCLKKIKDKKSGDSASVSEPVDTVQYCV